MICSTWVASCVDVSRSTAEHYSWVSVVDTAIETVRSSLEAKRQTVSVWRAEPSLSVDADSVRLCQVVANLLNNASKYSPEGARIEVRLEAAASEAVLSVRDEGAGIDPQLLRQIFDQFLQGDRSLDRSDGGLGIGLTRGQTTGRNARRTRRGKE